MSLLRLESDDAPRINWFRGTFASAAQLIVDAALDGNGGYACLCNVHLLETARRDTHVMEALAGARIVMPDGAPIAWLQRRNGAGVAERVGGPDLMASVFEAGCAVGLRHALYGSTAAVIGSLEAEILRRHPDAQIVASAAPPFGGSLDANRDQDIESLRTARPHVVWVALGAPRQELWVAESARALQPALVIGVGAAFDFLAGAKPRAPIWMQRAGFEWLHRALTEPRRLTRRYVTTNLTFLARLTIDLARLGTGRLR